MIFSLTSIDYYIEIANFARSLADYGYGDTGAALCTTEAKVWALSALRMQGQM